jgi:putative tryptophan/tyrosine transport system substrate-binding protein
VKLDPDVIVAQATPATTALLRLTHSIPVVFFAVSDPVGQGLVASIPRPGGNATGFTSFEFSVGSKWFELIKELAPGIRRLAAVFNPKTAPYAPRFIQSFDAAVRDFGAEIKPARIESVEEIEAVVRGVGGSDTGMVVMPDTFTTMHRQKIIDAAAKHRVVAIYPFSYMVRDGGLISYGVDVIDLFRQAASYVDRILRGTSAG